MCWCYIGEKKTAQTSGKMYQRRNFIQEFKHQLSNGSMTNRLVIANILVFVFIHLLFAIGRLNNSNEFDYLIYNLVTLEASWEGLLYMPWGLFTNMFSHFDLFHIFSNMIFLYFAGNLFEQFFNGKKLLIVYIFGGLLGGMSEIISSSVFFPHEQIHTVLGASGSVMAIFTALAFYSPNTKVFLFGMFPVRLFLLALFFLATDLIGIGNEEDHVAHFAHLGGALFGLLAVQKLNTNKNIVVQIELGLNRCKSLFKRKPKRNFTNSTRQKTDEQYNLEKRKKQDKTDIILDKISKAGYESLTKEEKDFLFKQSKNG